MSYIPENGDRVQDSEGYTGMVTLVESPHTVWVDYDDGSGEGAYCVVEDCHHYDPLIKI